MGGGKRRCGGAAEGTHSNIEETCKLQTEARCRRNLAARRQPRSVAHLVSDFSKMFTFPRSRKHCQDETEERRGCVSIPAYIDLCCSFLLRVDSCFSSNPRSHFFRLVWGASSELPSLMRLSRMLRRRRQFYGFPDLRNNGKTPPKAYLRLEDVFLLSSRLT